MPPWVPREFLALVHDIQQGKPASVTVREFVRWFGFPRRGSQVNAYILDAMRAHGITCTPAFDLVFADDPVTFTRTNPGEPCQIPQVPLRFLRGNTPKIAPSPCSPCAAAARSSRTSASPLSISDRITTTADPARAGVAA